MKKHSKLLIDFSDINRSFFTGSVEGILAFDKNFRIRLVNTSAENILGYNKDELNNKNINSIVPNQFQEEYSNLYNNFFKRKNKTKGIRLIVTFLKKDKTKIVAEASLSKHLHSAEGPLILILFSDITDRFNTEHVLKEEKYLYENVLEKMGDAFVSFDHNWKYTYINNIALLLIGEKKTKEEFLGKTFWEISPEAIGTVFEKKYREVMEKRKPVSFEAFSLSKDCWLEIRVCPHDTGIAIFSSDITQNKLKSEELKKSEERFVKAFRSSPVAFSISKLSDGSFVEVNNSFLNIFGFNHDDIIGKNSSEIGTIGNNMFGEREKIIRMLSETGSVSNIEFQTRKKSGAPISILFSADVIELNGEIHVLATMMDITEKRKTQEAILKMNELLENRVRDKTLELTQALEREKENNDLKSRFVSMASHEFRTPLAGILLSVSILEQYTMSENEKLVKHFNRINSSVSNLTDILNDFLSLEKFEQGKVKAINSKFDLKDLIEDVIEEMKASLKKGQRININLTGDSKIYQDKKIIYNTLLNLVSNASKYSEENKQINLDTEIKDEKITIIIKDRGIGIPKNDQDKMFTLFFRAKNAETIKGTGLGLNIVKKYMELIKGSIHFTSKENKGTEFTIEFPKNTQLEYSKSLTNSICTYTE